MSGQLENGSRACLKKPDFFMGRFKSDYGKWCRFLYDVLQIIEIPDMILTQITGKSSCLNGKIRVKARNRPQLEKHMSKNENGRSCIDRSNLFL